MENNLTDQKDKNSAEHQATISDERKMTIIGLMFSKTTSATFLKNRDGIKSFPLVTEEEKAFIDEVYEKIKDLGVGEEVLQVTNLEQLKDELYARCQIPKEAVERIKQERAEKVQESLKKIQEERDRINARIAAENEKRVARSMQRVPDLSIAEEAKQNQNEQVDYKEDLYQPNILCGHSIGMPELPFIEKINYTRERIENISPQTSYQFANKIYTIKKVGSILYMSAPNLQDSISEYEITISQDGTSKTVRRFGDISFNKMDDASYSTVVFLGLLGERNLDDKKLHGYLGSLELVKDQNKEGETESSYRVVYLPEEYTAIVIWEQIEKVRKGKRLQDQGKVLPREAKASGGDER